MKQPIAPLLLCSALGLGSTGCIVPHASVTPRYGQLEVDGDLFLSSSNTSAGSDTDALGLDDEEVLAPRVDLSFGGFHVTLSGYDVEYAGTGMAEGQFDLGGVVIAANDPTETNLDLRSASVLFTMDFVPTDLVDVGIGIGAAGFDFATSIESLTTNERLETEEEVILPVLAVRAEVELGNFTVNGIASGLSGEYGDVDATYVDADVFFQYDFSDLLNFYAGLLVGYRHILMDVEYDDEDARFDGDLTFSGPYFGLTIGL